MAGRTRDNSDQVRPFLELLVELQLEHKFRIEAALKERLAGVASSGTGKCQKLAKSIINFAGDEDDQLRASLQDLELRIGRAERWQQWQTRAQTQRLVTV